MRLRLLVFQCVMALLLMAGCISRPSRLEYALEFAGKNRMELEKVLDHYKGDSLKYRAACFLIENMPRWYAYDGWQLDTLHALMDRQLAGTLNTSDKKWQKFDYTTLEKVYDARVITSDYLIRNIEMSFTEWQERPWNRTLPFEDFCELILPYRIGNERLSEWRSLYRSYYSHLLDSLYTGSDVLEACKVINDELVKQDCKYCVDWNVPHHDADHLFHTRIGYCRENSDLIQYAMRSCGIPVAADFMPYSPDYRYSHEWNVVRDTTGKYIQFGYDGIAPLRNKTQSDGRKKGKVFRYCFALQKEREEICDAAGWNIEGLEGKYWKDVTSEYFGENEAVVNLSVFEKTPVGIAVFSTGGWMLVGEGIRKGGNKACFKNIEPSVIYMPVSLNSGVRSAGYPFMLCTDGHIEEFIPDTLNFEEVVLTRKMALIPRVAVWGYSQIGARIEGDVNVDFANPKLIAEIKDTVDYTFEIFKSRCHEPVKYVRYVPPVGLVQIAELRIYEDSEMESEIKLTPVTALPYIENVVDGDMLSYLRRRTGTVSVPLVFKLDGPVRIDRVYYIPRTDDNYVWGGDEYELLYNDGVNGWKTLGVRAASDRYITFRAPKNALLWLRDKTRGKEEQVFIYRNNRQWFNSDLGL